MANLAWVKPISPTGPSAARAAALNEAVVRFGAMQESREQQRTSRASEESRDETPHDEALIGLEGAEAQPSASPSAETARGASAASAHAEQQETASLGADARATAEGQEEQQEDAIARHAAEQHGKREVGRQDADRQLRTTRDMVGQVRAHDGTESPSTGRSTPPPSETAADGSAARASSPGSAHDAGAPAGAAQGGNAPTAGTQTAGTQGAGPSTAAVQGQGGPRVGGDVLAAAVGSGVTTAEEIAPGTAQGRDSDDNNAQDVQSSRQGVHLRSESQGRPVSRQRSLGGQTAAFQERDGATADFGSGLAQHRGGASGGGQRRGGGAAGEGGGRTSGDDEEDARHRRSRGLDAGLDASAESPADDGAVRSADHAAVSLPTAPPPDVRVVASAPPRTAADALVADAAGRSFGPQVALPADPVSASVLAPDGVAPPSAREGLGGGEEYFFFDDAHTIPEPADESP